MTSTKVSGKQKPYNGEEISVQEGVGNPRQDERFFLEKMYGSQARWFIAAGLIFGCILIYFQVHNFQFINFDDASYVYKNPHVMGGLTWENIKWALTTFQSANWHPLTWLSHQLDATLFGGNAGYHHLTNTIFHSANSVLLFFLLRQLTGATWKSGIVAAIFAFHPAHVESVAWVAERKDVLSTFFWLLTCWFYVKYVREEKKTRNYLRVIFFFALGLASKPMLVTLPFALLLLDHWPLKRFGKLDWKSLRPLLIEKIPLIVLAGISSWLTFLAQRGGGAVMGLQFLPLSSRVINAVVSYVKYIIMMFYPIDLGGWYPYREEGFPLWQIAGSAAVLTVTTALAIWLFYRKRYFFTGWFWFVGTLIPVIGLVQVGRQSHADRYTYVPFIGLSIAVVWFASSGIEKLRINKDLLAVGVIAILLFIGFLSFRQVSYWQNNESFYKHTLAVTQNNYLFEQNYCQYLLENDRLDEAEVQCRNSIEHNSALYANSWLSLGLIEMKKKNYADALNDFEVASRLRPSDIVAFSNYINALIALGRFDDAAESTERMKKSDLADEIKDPYLYPLYSQLSYVFAQNGETGKAIENARDALAIDATKDDQHTNLGLLLYNDGKKDEALAELTTALKIKPNQPDLLLAVGRIYSEQSQNDKAIEYFQNTLNIDPNNKPAREFLDKLRGGK